MINRYFTFNFRERSIRCFSLFIWHVSSLFASSQNTWLEITKLNRDTHFEMLFIGNMNLAMCTLVSIEKSGRIGTQLPNHFSTNKQEIRTNANGFMFVTKSKESLKFKMSRERKRNTVTNMRTKERNETKKNKRNRIVKRTIFPELYRQHSAIVIRIF